MEQISLQRIRMEKLHFTLQLDTSIWDALIFSLTRSFLNIVDLLLKRGADIQETDNEFNSPLHKAAIVHNAKAVELLLKRGADKEAG